MASYIYQVEIEHPDHRRRFRRALRELEVDVNALAERLRVAVGGVVQLQGDPVEMMRRGLEAKIRVLLRQSF
jgi:hypothetical protein